MEGLALRQKEELRDMGPGAFEGIPIFRQDFSGLCVRWPTRMLFHDQCLAGRGPSVPTL